MTDCSRYAPALYDADNYFILPNALKKNYINELFKTCLTNDIKSIISLNDIELPILAQFKNKFLEKGIKLIVSNPKVYVVFYKGICIILLFIRWMVTKFTCNFLIMELYIGCTSDKTF